MSDSAIEILVMEKLFKLGKITQGVLVNKLKMYPIKLVTSAIDRLDAAGTVIKTYHLNAANGREVVSVQAK